MQKADILERATRALYERNPYYDGGESLDGFQVTPAGCLSWDQCCEAYPEYVQALEEDARAVIEAIGLTTSSGTEITAEMVAILTNAFWQPITSAPKDGRPLMIDAGIIASTTDGEMVANRWEAPGYWDRDQQAWRWSNGIPIAVELYSLPVEPLRWRHPTEAEYLALSEQKEPAVEHG